VKALVEQKLPAKPVEVQKTQTEPKPVNETAKSAPPGIVSKAIEGAKTKAADEIKIQEVVPVPVAKSPAALPAIEEKTIAPAPAIAKFKTSQPSTDPVTAPANPSSRETEKAAKPSQAAIARAPSAKTEEVPRQRADAVPPLPGAEPAPSRQTKPAEPAVKKTPAAKPLDGKDRSVAPPTATTATTPAASEPVAKTLTPEPIEAPQAKGPAVTALRPSAEKSSPAIASGAPTVGVAKSAPSKVADPQTAPDKSPEPPATRKLEQPAPPLARLPQAKATEAPQTRPLPDAVAPALGVAKVEPAPAIKPEAKMPLAAPIQESANEKPEQLALLRKPAEPLAEKPVVTRPAPKPLEGFIIQVAFNDKGKAQSWAEKMQQRGYAVSVTEAGAEGSLRVRLGNFAMRDEAERQLRNFKQEGMSGIIINLPQAFRPEARSSLP
jgi:cell division protein FtsN